MSKYYITTAIPYANAAPHIGTAMDYLYGDILLRYQTEILKNEALMSIGTDEHGAKIAQKAADQGLTPQEFVDNLQPEFVKMRKAMNLDFDHIVNVRTTDPDHVRRVQEIWRKLDAAGVIYKSTYEGWYCVGCEAFLTETEAKSINYTCPDHNKPLEKISEDNYYLKVSKFTEQIRDFAANNIVPAWRGKEILELIKNGAQDVSISRPKEKLTWGIPVPDDDSQVMYVWVDALSNYITALGYPDNNVIASATKQSNDCHSELVSESSKENAEILKQVQDDNSMDFWPADVQIIGKDILRFHAIIWPAILLALGLDLPKKILVHGHILNGGAKMSKSLGNVVSPLEIIEKYGTDAFRYYFSRHIPTFDDGDFTWEKFENAYNGELANDLGNLVSRVANMVKKYWNGDLTKVDKSILGFFGYDHNHNRIRKNHPYGYYYAGTDKETSEKAKDTNEMEQLNINGWIDSDWVYIQNMNKYIDDKRPWSLAKDDNTKELSEVLSKLVNGILELPGYIAPYMPETFSKIREIFGGEKLPDEIPILFPKKYLHTTAPKHQ
ncbi:MAG: methionine--tRNA ligase [Candidatus Nomurabacteria bacterium]|jgi:methionyl-tRNA synthetase|nr:methionine--tRNA ligase [Candidatus Nomurabacteria bacterium]